MDVTISIPDEFAERVQRFGTSPEEFVKLLFSDAMRKARARELKSRPEDTQKFLDAWAAESKAQMDAEMLENEAAAKLEAKRLAEKAMVAAAEVETDQPEPSAPPT